MEINSPRFPAGSVFSFDFVHTHSTSRNCNSFAFMSPFSVFFLTFIWLSVNYLRITVDGGNPFVCREEKIFWLVRLMTADIDTFCDVMFSTERHAIQYTGSVMCTSRIPL